MSSKQGANEMTQAAIAKPGSMFSGLTKANTAPVGGLATMEVSTGAPFIGFLSRKANRFAEVRAALPNLQEGSLYYSDADGYKELDGNRIILLDSYQSWVQKDSGNKPIKATKTNPNTFTSPFRENIETLVLAFVGGTVKPAVMTFSLAKCKAAHAAKTGITNAGKPDWASRSPDHAASMQAPTPELRVVTTVHTSMSTSKGGNPQVNASGTAKPISAGEASVVNAASTDAKFQAVLTQARETFSYRVKQLEEVAAETAKGK